MVTKKATRSRELIYRLITAYVLLPFLPPVLLLIRSFPFNRMALADWIGIMLLYAVFSFVAMLLLGTPLLYVYFRLDLKGFIPFAIGGGFCAFLTSYFFLRGGRNLVEFFTVTGIVCGLCLRAILFGT